MHTTPNINNIEEIMRNGRGHKEKLIQLVAWGLFFTVLAWSWKGAEMRPFDLIKDAGNMATFAKGFFPPNFAEWRFYVEEMIVTIQIAVWGTVLSVLFSIPFGLLCSSNIVSPWI